MIIILYYEIILYIFVTIEINHRPTIDHFTQLTSSGVYHSFSVAELERVYVFLFFPIYLYDIETVFFPETSVLSSISFILNARLTSDRNIQKKEALTEVGERDSCPGRRTQRIGLPDRN